MAVQGSIRGFRSDGVGHDYLPSGKDSIFLVRKAAANGWFCFFVPKCNTNRTFLVTVRRCQFPVIIATLTSSRKLCSDLFFVAPFRSNSPCLSVSALNVFPTCRLIRRWNVCRTRVTAVEIDIHEGGTHLQPEMYLRTEMPRLPLAVTFSGFALLHYPLPRRRETVR